MSINIVADLSLVQNRIGEFGLVNFEDSLKPIETRAALILLEQEKMVTLELKLGVYELLPDVSRWKISAYSLIC